MMNSTNPARIVDRLERLELMDELLKRYGRGTTGLAGLRNRWRFLRKKYSWIVAVGGAKLLKRTIDVVVSAVALAVLAPLLLAVAILIKLTDGGPVLFWQSRVGCWGRDIPFPQQVELDTQYIESQNLWVDIKLLLRTIPAVLLGKGAY